MPISGKAMLKLFLENGWQFLKAPQKGTGEKMKYHFRVHRNRTGIWAECLELPGCQTQGIDRTDLDENMREALELYLSEPPDSKLILPLPKKSLQGRDIVEVTVSPNVAFAFYMKRLRLKYGLTQIEAAKRMGFKNLYSYQRLENASMANPQLTTLVQVKNAFPEFQLEDIIAAERTISAQSKKITRQPSLFLPLGSFS